MKESLFHRYIGGRRRGDLRFSETVPARLIRREIVRYRESHPGISNEEIAKRLNISGTTLSLAAGGRAGKKLGPDGKSTTSRILSELSKLNQTATEK